MRKWAVLLLALVCIGLASAKSLQIYISTNRTAPTSVVVNGMNFHNEINKLQNEYDQLSKALATTKASLNDYLYLTLFGMKVVKAYDIAIINALKNNDTAKALELIQKRDALEQKNLVILLQALTRKVPATKYQSLGWFDTAGDHHDFSDVVLMDENYDFRVTDCYSSIGESHVLKGGVIHITGFLYEPSKIGDSFKIVLIDPHGKKLLLWDGSVGENFTSPELNVTWNGCCFNITLNTSSMTLGLKQLDLISGNDTVSVQFVVVKPYLKVYHYDGWTEIVTNRPTVKVDGKIVHPVNGVLWIPEDNPKVEP